jgi:hypothetical protein
MICIGTKFHTPNSNDLLVIAIKPKTKYRHHETANLLFYSLQKIKLP